MGVKNATAKIFTDYRRERKDGKYPIKLRVTYKGQSCEYALGLFVTVDEDKILQSNKLGRNDYLKTINKSMVDYLSRANQIIDQLPVFNHSIFGREFLKPTNSQSNFPSTSLYRLLINRSEHLRKEGRISYADSFKTTANVIQEYKQKVLIDEIDVGFLSNLEECLLTKGNSHGCIGVYMRNIRTVFNLAIEEKKVLSDSYPFGKKKYCIPQQRNNKTALTTDEVMKILTVDLPEGSSEEKARDFWIFMYLTNGLNMKDVCLLKKSNLKPDLVGVNFFRAKTKRTTKHNKIEIDVWYDDSNKDIIQKIILKYGNKCIDDNDYLFPILNKNMTPTDERRLIQNFTRYINKNMAKVSKIIGLSSVPKTNVARHTFVTSVINEGEAPLTAVKDLVGHSSIGTTAGYVGTLPINKRKEYSKVLIKRKE